MAANLTLVNCSKANTIVGSDQNLNGEDPYPPMADYLDGIVKGDTAQVEAYIAACLAIKAKYPKQ